MNKTSFRRIEKRRGCTTIETAVLAPVFLLAALAAIDFCRVYQAEMIVSQAAHSAALYGAGRSFVEETRSEWEAGVRDVVDRELQQFDVEDGGDVQVAIHTQNENDLSFLATVEIVYPFRPICTSSFLSTEILIRRSQTIRRYR